MTVKYHSTDKENVFTVSLDKVEIGKIIGTPLSTGKLKWTGSVDIPVSESERYKASYDYKYGLGSLRIIFSYMKQDLEEKDIAIKVEVPKKIAVSRRKKDPSIPYATTSFDLTLENVFAVSEKFEYPTEHRTAEEQMAFVSNQMKNKFNRPKMSDLVDMIKFGERRHTSLYDMYPDH